MNLPNEDRKLSEETIDQKEVFAGNLLRLSVNTVRTPDGSTGVREVVHHPGGVVILPVLERNPGKELVLVRQYREPAGKPLWEFPAGTREEGESAKECARRELIEETGYRPGKLEKVVDLFTSPGYSDEILSLYRATGLNQVENYAQVEPPEDENLVVRAFPAEELMARASRGDIIDGKTLAGLFFFK